MKDQQILKLLYNAYNSIPYYNFVLNEIMRRKKIDDLADICFEDVPIHNKAVMRKIGWENFVKYDFDANSLHWDGKLENDEFVCERTSGTTGEPMDILWSKTELKLSLANHWIYRYRRFGISPKDRMFTAEQMKYTDEPFIIRDNVFVFNSSRYTKNGLEVTLQALNDFAPKWIYCQASVLFVILNFAAKENISLDFKINGIEFCSEPPLDYYIEYIDTIFHAPHINMYGCTETNGIAYSCEYDKLHIMHNNVLVELLNENQIPINSGKGQVCVTGLYNNAMPFIRYALDDIAEFDTTCTCGKKIFKLINCRLPEIILLNNHSIYPGAIMVFPWNKFPHLEETNSDVRFYLKRFKLDHYELYIDDLKGHDYEKLKSVFNEMFMCYGIDSNIIRVCKGIEGNGLCGILRIIS